jgi:hypothetical protein
LIIPTKVYFYLALKELKMNAKLDISILLGFLKFSIRMTNGQGFFQLFLARFSIYKTEMGDDGEKEEEEKIEEEPAVERSLQEKLRLFRGLVRPMIRIFMAILRHTHLKELDCRMDIGLSDPFYTGMVLGVIYPMWESIHPLIPETNLLVSPRFTEEKFDVSLRGRFTLIILLILIPILRLLISKEFRMLRKG